MKRDDLVPALQKRLRRLPAPFDAHEGVLPLPPPVDRVMVEPVQDRHSQANAALGRVRALAGELGDVHLVSRILARREAVSSAAIAGMHSTLEEVLVLEEAGDADAGGAALQVCDYARALDEFVPLARQQGPAIFTLPLMQELHRRVMGGEKRQRGTSGEFRSQVVWIGGRDIAYSAYNPPPPDDVETCLAQTIDYLRGEGPLAVQHDPVVRIAIAHAHFAAVHPFQDGNGRVARLLLPLMMASAGEVPLYLSPYIEANLFAYHRMLKAVQQRAAWHAIIGFMADAITATISELIATRDTLTSVRTGWKARRKFRANSAAADALETLAHYPVLSIKRLAGLLGVSIPAATSAVEQLVEAGILAERTGYRRNRIFAAPEVLAVLNRPFGEEPVLPDSGWKAGAPNAKFA